MKSLMPQIDSNDGLFHNGNPATGEQGTRVTDTWLNNLQDRVRDVQAEAHYVLQKAGFQPVENKQTQLYEAIVKIIDDNRKSASTTQKGEVRLTSDTGLDSEELGLTAKAGKKLAQQTAQLQLNVSQNYIPNSKKSSAVNSNSADTVATSAAVKTAYDKGVDAKTAADNAQSLANDANNNANGRILKTDISHVIDGSNKAKVASEFALGELNKKFTLSENLSETGWCKLPNGMILQWGSGTSQSSESGALFKFPLAFTKQCFSILATDVGGGTFAYGISPVNNAEFKVWSREIVRGKLAAGIFRWLAVGV